MLSSPTDPQAWRLTATLLDTACNRRGLRRVALADFNRLINALVHDEHPALIASALDCLNGKPDYPLMAAASIAARLAVDTRWTELLGFTPSAAALYRLQRNTPTVDLLALLHRASAHASEAELTELRRLLPAPKPQPSTWPKQDFAEHHDVSASLLLKPAPVRRVPTTVPGSAAPAHTGAGMASHTRVSGRTHRQPAKSQPHELQAQPKMRVFRAKTALTVEWGSLSHTPVLFFQVARRLNSQGDFDWGRRINIAVSAAESFELMQVRLGRTDYATLQFHGADRNKTIELKKNGDAKSGFTLLVRVGEAGSYAVLGLSGFDVASLMQLLSVSIASKLPITGNAAEASLLAQTAALSELARSC